MIEILKKDRDAAVKNPPTKVTTPVMSLPNLKWNIPNIKGKRQRRIVEDKTDSSTM